MHKNLITIIEQASTIFERLEDRFVPIESDIDKKIIIDFRLDKWCKIAAKGDQELFKKRLALDGLNIEKARRIIGSVRLTKEQDLPSWCNTLKKLIYSFTINQSETTKSIDSSNDIEKRQFPFEEVLLPFVKFARDQLMANSGSIYKKLLATEAYACLEKSLLKQLSLICSQTIALELNIARILGHLHGESPEGRYHDFIQKKFGSQQTLLSFFTEYSVIARLVAIAINRWVDSTSEFLLRLESDSSDIQQFFMNGKKIGMVINIEDNLSDPHNNGRTVKSLIFESGLKLTYKPRNVGLEQIYNELLSWFNDNGVSLQFKTFKVLNKITHGWVEFVERKPCINDEEVHRFYQRSGMNLCLLYILEATDCHSENIIAYGEYPVLVDMEALLQPRLSFLEDKYKNASAENIADDWFAYSVLRTGILPRWRFGEKGKKGYDISGLCGGGGQKLPFRQPRWDKLNTDMMELVFEYKTSRLTMNRPSLNGIDISPIEYIEDVVNGFHQMYQYIMDNKNALLDPEGPFAKLSHQKVRFICRDTQFYHYLLHRTFDPNFMRNGADRSIYIDVTCQSFLLNGQEHLWPLLRMEQNALQQMDIPFFTVRADSDALELGLYPTLEKCFREPSYNRVVSRLNRLNIKDLEQQTSFIRSSLCAYSTGFTHDLRKSTELNLVKTPTLTSTNMVEQAIAIAEDLKKRAICSTDGSATWIGLECLPEAGQLQLQPLSDNLYNGRCGIALFLAALEALTNGAGYSDLALDSLQTLCRKLHGDNATEIAKTIGIGGMLGIGSIIYTLTRVGQFLNNADLILDAKQAAHLITPELISRDRMFDVMDGSAGAILALLTLYSYSSEIDILNRAILCGEHLLKNRVGGKHHAWKNIREKPLTGFSHGAAGIAYALLRLYRATGDTTFLEPAIDAMAYERNVFSHHEGNWPDFRFIDRRKGPSYMTAWCHGAAGIGLGRTAGLEILDTDEIRKEIEIALKATLKFGLHDKDHLCCGNFGRIEFLVFAANKISQPHLLKTAIKQTSWILERARRRGSFHLFDFIFEGVYNPTFFYGTAGIGYELLRLADDQNSIPSILLLE